MVLVYFTTTAKPTVHIPNYTYNFLVNDQCDAQFFTMYLFLFLTLYMFRAHRARHQERQIVSAQPLVTVTLCRWPCRAHHTATDTE